METELKIKIYELGKRGMTYESIVKYFEGHGTNVSYEQVKSICEGNYKETPKLIESEYISDEEIYELRNLKKSYKQIEKYFRDKGKKISTTTIGKRCKIIYGKKKEEEPNAINKKDVSDEEIYKLKKSGKSYRQIKKYYKDNGKEISAEAIRRRYERISKEKKEEEKEAEGKPDSSQNIKGETLDELERKLQAFAKKKIKSGKLVEGYEMLQIQECEIDMKTNQGEEKQ